MKYKISGPLYALALTALTACGGQRINDDKLSYVRDEIVRSRKNRTSIACKCEDCRKPKIVPLTSVPDGDDDKEETMDEKMVRLYPQTDKEGDVETDSTGDAKSNYKTPLTGRAQAGAQAGAQGQAASGLERVILNNAGTAFPLGNAPEDDNNNLFYVLLASAAAGLAGLWAALRGRRKAKDPIYAQPVAEPELYTVPHVKGEKVYAALPVEEQEVVPAGTVLEDQIGQATVLEDEDWIPVYTAFPCDENGNALPLSAMEQNGVQPNAVDAEGMNEEELRELFRMYREANVPKSTGNGKNGNGKSLRHSMITRLQE